MGRFLRIGARTVPVLAMMAAGVGQIGITGASAAPLGCGSVITTNTTLSNNIGPCAGDGLTIAASNITLNMDNHKVWSNTTGTAGTLAGEHVGIHFAGVSGSQVKDGEVYGFAAGVRIDGGGMNTVKSIKAHDNVGPRNADNNGDGIAAWNSSNNTIMDNTVMRNGPFSGIALLTGPYNVYSDVAQTATGNVVKDNTVTFNNTARCGPLAGCHPRDPNTGAVTVTPLVPQGGITTSTLDGGVRVEGPNETNSQVIGNKISDSGIDGVFVQASCHNAFMSAPPGYTFCVGDVGNTGTLIKDNTSDHNGYGRAQGSGVDLWSMLGLPGVIPSKYSTVVGNTARNNYSEGIEVYSTCGATDNPALCASNHNTIVENSVSGNHHDGIIIRGGSDANVIKGNKATGNLHIGIELRGANSPEGAQVATTNNTVTENNSSGNTPWDNADFNPACGSNSWSSNSGTKNQACVN